MLEGRLMFFLCLKIDVAFKINIGFVIDDYWI
jgi:hypothetical protein